MQRMRLWKESETRQPNQHTLWPNVLVYDPVFADDIRTGAIPTDFQSVLALSDNMGPLSLYQFEAHSSYLQARLGKPDRAVPILGSSGLLAQIGCNVRESDTRKARATIRHWHGIVKRLWPDCPNELARDDTVLIVRAGYAIKHGRLPTPEEFGVRPLDQLALERMRESSQRPAIDRLRVFSRERRQYSAAIPKLLEVQVTARAAAEGAWPGLRVPEVTTARRGRAH